jgi:hypothetical protein
LPFHIAIETHGFTHTIANVAINLPAPDTLQYTWLFQQVLVVQLKHRPRAIRHVHEWYATVFCIQTSFRCVQCVLNGCPTPTAITKHAPETIDPCFAQSKPEWLACEHTSALHQLSL